MKTLGKTLAVRILDDAGVSYELHPYQYRAGGEIGLEAAAALSIDPTSLFKAVVLEGNDGAVVALVPSNRRVALGKLMKALRQTSRAAPVAPERAQFLSGYLVGGISPLGLRHDMTVCVDESIVVLDKFYMNAGRRGLMVAMPPDALLAITDAILADIVD
jgi:Cys-tRNA(Pro)/Cys-tRNA(Cys) deacylase